MTTTSFFEHCELIDHNDCLNEFFMNRVTTEISDFVLESTLDNVINYHTQPINHHTQPINYPNPSTYENNNDDNNEHEHNEHEHDDDFNNPIYITQSVKQYINQVHNYNSTIENYITSPTKINNQFMKESYNKTKKLHDKLTLYEKNHFTMPNYMNNEHDNHNELNKTPITIYESLMQSVVIQPVTSIQEKCIIQ